MPFNQAAVNALFSAVVSVAQESGVFARVNQHEPVSNPGVEVSCSIWVQDIQPVTASGLDATSGVVVFNARVVKAFTGGSNQDYDAIDPLTLNAVTTLIAAYSGGFTLDGIAREVDLLGAYGERLGATAGYVPYGDKQYRAMTVTIPVVINDMFTQEA